MKTFIQLGAFVASLMFPIVPVVAVTIVSPSSDRVEVRTEGCFLKYDGNAEAVGVFSRFLEDGEIRGLNPMGGWPKIGGFSLRWLGLLYAPYVHSDYPWHTSIRQTDSPIGAFDAWVDTSEWMDGTRNQPFDARVTYVFFDDLPEVVLFDIESIRKDTRVSSHAISVQAYGPATQYNSMRFWNDDPDGIDVGYGAGFVAKLHESDPTEGVSVEYDLENTCSYYDTPLTRGLVVAQKDGENDWVENPPCGWLIKKNELWAATHCQSGGGYWAHIACINMAEKIDATGETTRNQLLWFQGSPDGELNSWDSLFNLDDAWNQPCTVKPVITDAPRAEAYLVEESGLDRDYEITVLPEYYASLETENPILRGGSCVLLQKNMAAHEERSIGSLPVRVEPVDDLTFQVVNEVSGILHRAEIHLPLPEGFEGKVTHGGQELDLEIRDRTGVYVADVEPGQVQAKLIAQSQTGDNGAR